MTSESERLSEARDDARREAVPVVLIDAALLIALAVISKVSNWELLGAQVWWLWLVVAAPLVVLGAWLLAAIGRVRGYGGRSVARWLLIAIGVGTALGVAVLIVSLASPGKGTPSGAQLLASAFVVLVTNVVTFALAYWELDCGGPVRRAMASERTKPDFQFPQDENRELAAEGWEPRLPDYAYVALTNAMAFSPTDVMPLTRNAKLLMSIESVVSITTLLIVAARAVNVLAP